MKTITLLASGICAVLSAPGALAQTSTDGPEEQASGEPSDGDIIVTALKRATNIQDTPIAMRAFEGEQVTKSGIADIRSLVRLAPDLAFSTRDVNTQLFIRGIGTQDVSESSDPAVTVNIDGEYINRPTALNATFFDLERIEVLRGPQGTLYGRNASGGALNIVAAKPEYDRFGGYLTASYGNYDSKMVQAAANLPVGDDAAFRVAYLHNDHDGYSNNPPAGRGGTGNIDATRISFGARPAERVKLYLAGEYVNVDQTGAAQVGAPVNAATPGVVDPNPATAIVEGGGIPALVRFNFDPDNFPLPGLGSFKSEQYAVRGRVDYDLGAATVSYIAGYRDTKTSLVQFQNGFIPETATGYYPKLNSKTQSHELRAGGPLLDAGTWQAGVFYFKEVQDYLSAQYSAQLFGGSYVNTLYRPALTAESRAAFAQITVPLAGRRLSVSGGIRYTEDKKYGRYTNFGLQRGSGRNNFAKIGDPGSRVFDADVRSSKLNWSAGIDWRPSDDHLIYVKAGTAYKAGGVDGTNRAYLPENLTAYEIGTKNDLAGGRIKLNAAAFHYDFKDQQITLILDPAVGRQTVNAGSSRVWGIDTDAIIQVGDDGKLGLMVNYLNAKFLDFPSVLPGLATPPLIDFDAVAPGVQTPNLRGNIPVQSPKWIVSASYEHVFRIGGAKIISKASTRYKSAYFLTVFNFAADRQKSFTQTDVSLEYISPDDRFSLLAYVRNVENYRALDAANFNAGGVNIYFFVYGAPRTFGLQGSFKF